MNVEMKEKDCIQTEVSVLWGLRAIYVSENDVLLVVLDCFFVKELGNVIVREANSVPNIQEWRGWFQVQSFC